MDKLRLKINQWCVFPEMLNLPMELNEIPVEEMDVKGLREMEALVSHMSMVYGHVAGRLKEMISARNEL